MLGRVECSRPMSIVIIEQQDYFAKSLQMRMNDMNLGFDI